VPRDGTGTPDERERTLRHHPIHARMTHDLPPKYESTRSVTCRPGPVAIRPPTDAPLEALCLQTRSFTFCYRLNVNPLPR